MHRTAHPHDTHTHTHTQMSAMLGWRSPELSPHRHSPEHQLSYLMSPTPLFCGMSLLYDISLPLRPFGIPDKVGLATPPSRQKRRTELPGTLADFCSDAALQTCEANRISAYLLLIAVGGGWGISASSCGSGSGLPHAFHSETQAAGTPRTRHVLPTVETPRGVSRNRGAS